MTQEEIKAMLDTLDIPNAYYEFPDDSGTVPPFICFYYGQSDDFYADDSNYQNISTLYIELYTDVKDFSLESKLETTLSRAGLSYSKNEAYIKSERLHETIYQMEVINNG